VENYRNDDDDDDDDDSEEQKYLLQNFPSSVLSSTNPT